MSEIESGLDEDLPIFERIKLNGVLPNINNLNAKKKRKKTNSQERKIREIL